METLKLVVVGDGAVGKTSMLISYTTNSFPRDYVPTVFDNYAATIAHHGKTYSMGFWDTAGQEDYDRLRPLSYPQTDVFLMCFSVVGRTSFDNVKSKWWPEIQHHCPQAQVLLVGLKTDLRRDSAVLDKLTARGQLPVSEEEGIQLGKELGIDYAECSALTQDGLARLFDKAMIIHTGAGNGSNGPRRKKGGAHWLGSLFSRNPSLKHEPQPPVLPEKTWAAPYIYVDNKTFHTDMARMLFNETFSDVAIVVGETTLPAHRVVLAMGSALFRGALGLETVTNVTKVFPKIETRPNTRSDASGDKACVSLFCAPEITVAQAKLALEFVYTGGIATLSVSDEDERRASESHHRGGRPKRTFDQALCNDARAAAQHFDLDDLTSWVDNCDSGETFFNPSIQSYRNEVAGQKARDMFLNKPLFADVVFFANNGTCFGHRAILFARCGVLRSQFEGGRFVDARARQQGDQPSLVRATVGDCDVGQLRVMIEFLYATTCAIHDCDVLDLLRLADRYGCHRLKTLVELYVSKAVDEGTAGRLQRSDIDLNNVIEFVTTYKADQLKAMLLHFVSTNYGPVAEIQDTDGFDTLGKENRAFVEKHRWPPVSYLKELEEYERKRAGSKSGLFSFSLFK